MMNWKGGRGAMSTPGPAMLVTVLASLVGGHALFAIARSSWGISLETVAPTAWVVTCASLMIGVTVSWRIASLFETIVRGTAVALPAAVLAGMWAPEAQWPFFSLVPLAILSACLSRAVAGRMPRELLSGLRKPWRMLWWLAAVLAIVQMARLSTYVSNPESNWFLTTQDALFAKHECANAYVYAAELHDRGEPNIYDPTHYPGLNREAEPHSEMHGMAVEDPFQYPPPFLLLPIAARALTLDYAAIRSVWFALNVIFCLGSVVVLSLWLGQRFGWGALLLSPLMAIAVPVLHNFQYGQFHFATVALAAMGLLALEQGRRFLGAGLLATAVVAKLFPVYLLVLLWGQKRYRDLSSVLVGILALGAVSWFVLGSEPYVAFFGAHLERLSSGSAFAFGEAWPEIADLLIAGNQGVFGMVNKLGAAGFEFFDAAVASSLSRAYSLLLLPATWYVGRVLSEKSPEVKASVWLSVLGLASLASTGAWADYVPLTGVWSLVVLLGIWKSQTGWRNVLLVAGVLQVTLLGAVPLGSFANPSWMLPLSFLGGLGLFFIFFVGTSLAWGLFPQRRLARSESTHSQAHGRVQQAGAGQCD